MFLIDIIRRRTKILYQEGRGINLAVYSINEFKDRTFTFKGLKNRYFGLSEENLLKRMQKELDSMLILYHYTTRVKKYADKKGVAQVEIKLVGKATTMGRYNLLDLIQA